MVDPHHSELSESVLHGDQSLQKAGLKLTRPRRDILRVLEEAANTGQHLSADDILQQLEIADRQVGLTTIYRVLNQFEHVGLVDRHNFEGEHAVFELAHRSHHDHMVCVESGRIEEFCNSDIERLQSEIAEAAGYDLVGHRLVLFVRPQKGGTD